MRVLLTNAYSAGNSGDGLLVELAVALVREALGPDAQVSVAAQDPRSFVTMPGVDVFAPLGAGRRSMATRGSLALVTGGRAGLSSQFQQALEDCDLVLCVGGAYLRGGDPTELAKSTLAHLSQIVAVSRSGRPWLLLPQSIGPYPPAIHRWVRHQLSRARHVVVRDDTSARELASLPQVVRMPDSAILALTEDPTSRADRPEVSGPVALVLRQLARAPGFVPRLRELIGLRDDWVPALQSTYSGNDDRSFYRQLGMEPDRTLEALLRAGAVGSVLSVRLHGALRSIMLGVPTVHLSYERKGFSAFHDLGLGDFVFDARTFEAGDVSAAVERVRVDPDAYWDRVRAALPRIGEQRRELIGLIRGLATQPAPEPER